MGFGGLGVEFGVGGIIKHDYLVTINGHNTSRITFLC